MPKIITAGETVNLRDTVQVKGIKHKDSKKQKLQEGKIYDVHPLSAENLIETGHAVAVSEDEETTTTTKRGKK